MSPSTFSKFSWAVVIYNMLVIMWGAFVRATGSGAGCGSHWPLCNGEVLPRNPQAETLIEFAHRISSGLVILLVIVLIFFAFRLYSKGSLVRKAAIFSMLFTITEALFGAALVLLELVGDNDSIHRAFMMMIHLINTFLLLAALSLTAWWSTVGPPAKLTRPKTTGGLLIFGIVGMIVLGASGAVTALGDTLFPATSLIEGIRDEFSAEAHILLRLRIFHPGIAIGVGVYLIGLGLYLRRQARGSKYKWIMSAMVGLYLAQLMLGVINVILLAPVWMQLVHLLVSDLIWITLILTTELFFSARVALQSTPHHVIHDRVSDATP